MLEFALRNALPNPFESPDRIRRQAAEKYAATVRLLAQNFIYGTKPDEDLNQDVIRRAIDEIREDRSFYALERKEHALESLLHLLLGMEAHERVDAFYTGTWQAELRNQAAPETLTRQKVAQIFASFKHCQLLIDAEVEALKHYGKLLEKPDYSFALSENISLDRTDIQVFINDIQARIAERIPDDQARKAKLMDLDRELSEIIERIPEERRGKRFEIEEIYLLRRLIHSADTGHLASVSHGTPREDLRPDLGSVDIRITAAGDIFIFQIKTLKLGVSRPTRARQREVYEMASQSLEESPTHLAALTAENVQEAYEKALRRGRDAQTSRADKYTALEPMAGDLNQHQRQRLFSLLGLTEQGFRQEEREFESKEVERRKQEDEIKLKREADKRRRAEDARRAELEALEQQKLTEERMARIANSEQRQREIIVASRRAHELASKAETEKQRSLREKLSEAAEIEATHRAERAKLAERQAVKEARYLARESRKKEAPDWPPKTLAGLCQTAVLIKLGLLAQDWKDPKVFLAAKKEFFRLYAEPRRGAVEATEKDRPNHEFRKRFATKESWEALVNKK